MILYIKRTCEEEIKVREKSNIERNERIEIHHSEIRNLSEML